MENDILDSLNDLGYDGPLTEETAFAKALEGGPKSLEFTKLVHILAEELKKLCHLEETVTMMNSPDESSSFLLELSSFLKELGCPYKKLVIGHMSARLQSKEDRLLLLDYLISELMAARMATVDGPKDKSSAGMDIVMQESPTAKDLKEILISLKFNKPPPNITPEMLFSKLESKLKDTLQKEGDQLVGKPLYNKAVSEKEWKQIETNFTEMFEEYRLRRETLITRLECTIQSFEWSDRLKNKKDVIQSTYRPKREQLKVKPDVKLSDFLAARTDLLTVEKTSSATVRKNTQSDVNKVIIGQVGNGIRPNSKRVALKLKCKVTNSAACKPVSITSMLPLEQRKKRTNSLPSVLTNSTAAEATKTSSVMSFTITTSNVAGAENQPSLSLPSPTQPSPQLPSANQLKRKLTSNQLSSSLTAPTPNQSSHKLLSPYSKPSPLLSLQSDQRPPLQPLSKLPTQKAKAIVQESAKQPTLLTASVRGACKPPLPKSIPSLTEPLTKAIATTINHPSPKLPSLTQPSPNLPLSANQLKRKLTSNQLSPSPPAPILNRPTHKLLSLTQTSSQLSSANPSKRKLTSNQPSPSLPTPIINQPTHKLPSPTQPSLSLLPSSVNQLKRKLTSDQPSPSLPTPIINQPTHKLPSPTVPSPKLLVNPFKGNQTRTVCDRMVVLPPTFDKEQTKSGNTIEIGSFKRGLPDDTQSLGVDAKRAKVDVSPRQIITFPDLKVAVVTVPRRNLTKSQADELKMSIDNSIVQFIMSSSNSNAPAFRERPYLTNGALAMWCENINAFNWLKEAVKTIPSPISETTLNVIELSTLKMRFTAEVLLQTRYTNCDKIHKFLCAQNPWYNVNTWHRYRITVEHKVGSDEKSVHLLLGIPEEEKQTVLERGCQIAFMLGSWYMDILG